MFVVHQLNNKKKIIKKMLVDCINILVVKIAVRITTVTNFRNIFA